MFSLFLLFFLNRQTRDLSSESDINHTQNCMSGSRLAGPPLPINRPTYLTSWVGRSSSHSSSNQWGRARRCERLSLQTVYVGGSSHTLLYTLSLQSSAFHQVSTFSSLQIKCSCLCFSSHGSSDAAKGGALTNHPFKGVLFNSSILASLISSPLKVNSTKCLKKKMYFLITSPKSAESHVTDAPPCICVDNTLITSCGCVWGYVDDFDLFREEFVFGLWKWLWPDTSRYMQLQAHLFV